MADEARPPARGVHLHVRPHVPLLAGQPREHHHHAGGRARPPPAAPVVPPSPHPAPAPASRPLPQGPGQLRRRLEFGGRRRRPRARVGAAARARAGVSFWGRVAGLGDGGVLVDIMLWSIREFTHWSVDGDRLDCWSQPHAIRGHDKSKVAPTKNSWIKPHYLSLKNKVLLFDAYLQGAFIKFYSKTIKFSRSPYWWRLSDHEAHDSGPV